MDQELLNLSDMSSRKETISYCVHSLILVNYVVLKNLALVQCSNFVVWKVEMGKKILFSALLSF